MSALSRLKAGSFKLTSQPNIVASKNFPPVENPAYILLVLAVPTGILMFWGDYSLGNWMTEFPMDLLPAVHFITDLGRGMQILVGTGLFLILSAVAPISRLGRSSIAYLNVATEAAAFIFLSVSAGGLVALGLKHAIGRARPTLIESQGYLSFRPFAMHSDFAALPSGHSATAAGMAISLALLLPRFRAIFIVIGVLICVSRQLVGMHWSSDTIAGWAVGAACAYWTAHWFARREMLFNYDNIGRLQLKMSNALARPERNVEVGILPPASI